MSWLYNLAVGAVIVIWIVGGIFLLIGMWQLTGSIIDQLENEQTCDAVPGCARWHCYEENTPCINQKEYYELKYQGCLMALEAEE